MRGNRRGPMNRGPKTGRGMGYCGGHNTPGYRRDEGSYSDLISRMERIETLLEEKLK